MKTPSPSEITALVEQAAERIFREARAHSGLEVGEWPDSVSDVAADTYRRYARSAFNVFVQAMLIQKEQS